MQIDVIGIADRRDGGEPVERAAQDNDDEPRIARARRARPARDASRRRRSRRRRRGARDGSNAEQRIATSLSPLEFRRQNQQRVGLLLASRRAPPPRASPPKRRRPSTSSSRTGGRGASFTWRANCAASSTRVFMPSGEAQAATLSSVKPLGPPGCQSGIPEQIERAKRRAGIVGRAAERAIGGDSQFPGVADFGRRRAPRRLVIDQRAGERGKIAVGVAKGLGEPRRPAPDRACRRRNGARIWLRDDWRSPVRAQDRRAPPRPGRRRLAT